MSSKVLGRVWPLLALCSDPRAIVPRVQEQSGFGGRLCWWGLQVALQPCANPHRSGARVGYCGLGQCSLLSAGQHKGTLVDGIKPVCLTWAPGQADHGGLQQGPISCASR